VRWCVTKSVMTDGQHTKTALRTKATKQRATASTQKASQTVPICALTRFVQGVRSQNQRTAGHYNEYMVQLAWEAWQARAAHGIGGEK
jgi:hypothetical protein